MVFSQLNMTEILFLILYKAKGDITEREGRLEGVTAWRDLFCTVFSVLI